MEKKAMDAKTYREKVIAKLRQIQQEHAKRTCSRSSLMQAQAIGYAIEVLKKIPTDDETDQG